jgi:hypothetical protein
MQRAARSEVIQVAACFHGPTSSNRFVILSRAKDLTFAVLEHAVKLARPSSL